MRPFQCILQGNVLFFDLSVSHSVIELLRNKTSCPLLFSKKIALFSVKKLTYTSKYNSNK